MGDSNNCRDWEHEYVKNKFTMTERAVAAVLVAMGLTLLILGGFTNGYAQSVLAEGGTGVILFCALGLAAPRRLPPWSVLALAVVGNGVLFCGTRVPDSFGYLQSIAADIGIAILLFIVLDRIVADLAIQPLEYLLIALRLFSVFTARNLRDDYQTTTGPRPVSSDTIIRLWSSRIRRRVASCTSGTQNSLTFQGPAKPAPGCTGFAGMPCRIGSRASCRRNPRPCSAGLRRRGRGA